MAAHFRKLGAYQTCATEADIALWEENGRDDILEWILDIAPGVYDIWMHPETGDYVSRCPWLRKLPRQEKYICRDSGAETGDMQGLSGIKGIMPRKLDAQGSRSGADVVSVGWF